MAKIYQLDTMLENEAQFKAFICSGNDNSQDINKVKKLVRNGIDSLLTEKQKTYVTMHYFNNMSKKEIAQQLGVHPSTITRTIQAAQKRLSVLGAFL